MGKAALNKKIRQLYRRDVRQKLGMEVTIFDRLMRERPRFVPLLLWAQLARLFFRKAWLPYVVDFKGRVKEKTAKPKTRQNGPNELGAVTTEEQPAHDSVKAG